MGENTNEQNRRRESLTLEQKEMLESLKKMVAPVVKNEMDFLSTDKDQRYLEVEAERLIVHRMMRLTDVAKSELRDYEMADKFSAVAFAVAVSSEDPGVIAMVTYEYSDNKYYDVLNMSRDGHGLNVPMPMINRDFLRLMSGRFGILSDELEQHNRQFSGDPESIERGKKQSNKELKRLNELVDVDVLVKTIFTNEVSDE